MATIGAAFIQGNMVLFTMYTCNQLANLFIVDFPFGTEKFLIFIR